MRPHEGNGSLEDRRLQIAVAGGSIGGLCAGLALHGSGFDVNVYERHPGPMDTRGAGIVVQGELVQLLDTYGAPPLLATSCRGRRYLDPQAATDRCNLGRRRSPHGRRFTKRFAPPFPRSAITWVPLLSG